MSLSKIQQPSELTPAYNPMWWVFNSTNSSETGMRYVFKIMDSNNNILATLPAAPHPDNGYGYIDISKIISSNVSYDLDVNDDIIDIPNSIFEYQINVSERFLYEWEFVDTIWNSGTTRVQGTMSHLFLPGDGVNIIVDNIDTASQSYSFIEGFHNIVAVGVDYFDVDRTHTSTGTNPGKVTYANRTQVTLTGATFSDNYAFNGRRTTAEFINYNDDTYKIPGSGTSSTRQFLTSMPVDFRTTLEQDLWLNFFKDPDDADDINIKFENSNGDVFITNNVWTATASTQGSQVAVGPNNVVIGATVSGTLPLIKSDTEWYELWLNSDSTEQLTQKYRINLDRRCKIEDYELLFMDKMGSFISYAFQLRAKITGTADRKTYNKVLGTFNNAGWSYQSVDGGETIYSINHDLELELNSNWMTNEMSELFEQVYTSGKVLLKDIDGNYYPVIVQDNGFERQLQKNKILIKKSIKVKYANKEITNI